LFSSCSAAIREAAENMTFLDREFDAVLFDLVGAQRRIGA
jgi:hypothetical protein